MPQPVALQYSDQSVGLPANYTLPPGQAFDFSSVTARINGAGASGAFLVVLDLLSQDDKVIASSRIDQEFAAGDTAVVSFAPDFRRKATSVTPPPSGGGIHVLTAGSSDDLAAGATHVAYAEFGGYTDGTYMDVNASGNLRILGRGVYMIQWWSRQWVFDAGVTSNWEVLADVISGSNGTWTGDGASFPGLAFASVLGRIDTAAGPPDVTLGSFPDMTAFAAWDDSDTFPVVISTTYEFFKDKVSSAAATPRFSLYVVRFGDEFE